MEKKVGRRNLRIQLGIHLEDEDDDNRLFTDRKKSEQGRVKEKSLSFPF